MEDPKSLKKDVDKLEELELYNCENLIRCPIFLSNMTYLKRLDFGSCAKMTKLDPSFGHLKNLTDLIWRNCKSLKELPQEVSQLASLIRLDLTGCYQISALPESMRHLKQLNWLSLRRCSSLTEIPECICSFLNLEKLFASHCQRIAFLPNWIGKLKSLIELDLSWTAIEKLPHSIVSLENLEYLSVSHCYRLKFLPWFPPSLTTPEARGCGKVEDVPGITHMKLLRRLHLQGCRSLQDSFLENLCYVFYSIGKGNSEGYQISGRSQAQNPNLAAKKGTRNIEAITLQKYSDFSFPCPAWSYKCIRAFGSHKFVDRIYISGTRNVEDVIPQQCEDLSLPLLDPASALVHLRIESFEAMSQLRLLHLGNVTLEGGYEHFPRTLRWLIWSPRNLESFPETLHLENIDTQNRTRVSCLIDFLFKRWTQNRLDRTDNWTEYKFYLCSNLFRADSRNRQNSLLPPTSSPRPPSPEPFPFSPSPLSPREGDRRIESSCSRAGASSSGSSAASHCLLRLNGHPRAAEEAPQQRVRLPPAPGRRLIGVFCTSSQFQIYEITLLRKRFIMLVLDE
ncbi:Plant intracellular Ras-group-related LRR protein 9 [Nymphaea thermarum]|nr:Plant intracellular Ras-group-related LRR protein 9 [Nymphaea thermarum]